MIKKILTLENEIEALRVKDILDAHNIRHMISSFHDSAYDGLWQNQWGWGALEADDADEENILTLLAEIKHGDDSEELTE
jgi:hypothetical protein